MLAYYTLLGVPLLTAVIFRITDRRTLKENRFNPTILIFFIILYFLLTLRNYRVGSDTLNYWREFAKAGNLSLSELFSDANREYGFLLLTKLVRSITGNFRIYLAILNLVIVIPLAWYYQKNSEYPLLTIALFVTIVPFSMYFSGIRQIMAMSVGLVAWQMTKERKLIWFIVFVLLASQFHVSALMLFAMYPLYKVRITTRWLIVVVPIILLIYVFNRSILSLLSSLLWKEYDYENTAVSITVLLLLAAFAVYAYFIPDPDKLDDDVIALRNMLLLSIVLQSFVPIHPLAMRMNYYFLMLIPILIPKIAARAKPELTRFTEVSVLVMLVGFTVYFFYNAYFGKDSLHIFPYILLG